MRKLISKIKSWFNDEPKHFHLLYRNEKGRVRLYVIGDPFNKSVFGNMKEKDPNVGFRAKVKNRNDECRSFRYDRIVSLNSN